jgi:hypothetical protein
MGHLQAITAAAKHRGSSQQQQQIAPGGMAVNGQGKQSGIVP